MTERRIEFLHEEIEKLTAELKALTYTNIVCAECGSDDVVMNAAVTWDIETQTYEISNIFDKGHSCDECGDCYTKEVSL